MIVLYSKQMKFSTFFFSDNWSFSIIVFERFALIREFSIHKSHFVSFSFVQNENFRFFIIFFHVKQIKTFEKSYSTETRKKIKKKTDISLSIVIEKSNTFFEIVLRTNTFSNESLSSNLKILVERKWNSLFCWTYDVKRSSETWLFWCHISNEWWFRKNHR